MLRELSPTPSPSVKSGSSGSGAAKVTSRARIRPHAPRGFANTSGLVGDSADGLG